MKSFQVLTPYLFVLSVKTRKSSKQQKKRYIHLYHLIKRNFKLLWKLTKIEKNTEAKSFDDLMILSVKKTSMLISVSVYPTIISNRSPEQREKKQHIQSASCSIDETKAFFLVNIQTIFTENKRLLPCTRLWLILQSIRLVVNLGFKSKEQKAVSTSEC